MAIMTTDLNLSSWNLTSVHCWMELINAIQYNADGVEEDIIVPNAIYRFDVSGPDDQIGQYYSSQGYPLEPDNGYWIRVTAPGHFTYDCPDIDGGGPAYIFPSLWVRGDGDGTHIPPWRVNYISYTFPTPLSMNSLFPGSWYDSDPDVGEASPGVLTNQDVIYTDFWNYTAGGEIVENKPSSYYDGAEWVPNIILQPGRGYVLKTRLNGYVKWTLN